jgi:homoserine O-acetyltransferase
MKSRIVRCLALLFLAAIQGSALAYEPLVEKRTFEMDSFTTQGGVTIPDVKVGWEAYGELNEAKDNVILITHYFSGNSHAAGRYTADGDPGYWNSIIGSGKPIDTDEYYVISVDSLVNLGANDPNVVTTGPATTNPETGEPYGMDFPVVTIRDFVEVQRTLLDELGIERLHAVMGASMGSMQAYEWASAYPDRVERVIPVIGSGWASAWLIGWLDIWARPITLDPNWNGGDYYGGERPLDGLAAALKTVTLHAQHFEWANESFGRAWADADQDPAAAFGNRFQVQAVLDAAASARARTADANHFLYLAKASQLFLAGGGDSPAVGLRAIDAPALIIHTPEDLVFPPEGVEKTAAFIESDGTPVNIVELQGTRGHLDGVLNIEQAGPAIREFLDGE